MAPARCGPTRPVPRRRPAGAERGSRPLSHGCQHHAAMAALKQRYAQPCLELLDPSAQRRLRDGTTFRSTAEMALLGQSTEKAELLKTGQDGHRNCPMKLCVFIHWTNGKEWRTLTHRDKSRPTIFP